MTVTVYRSSDASAPVLTGTAGTLNTLLHACLVTGYGAKSAAGWAREFQSGQVSVYRAASGRRFRLRVDDGGTDYARFLGYEVMTDADTGTGPFPTNAQVGGGLYCLKSNTSDSTARPWVLVANETALYFLPLGAGTDWLTAPASGDGLSGHFFFGDLVPYLSGDNYASAVFGAVNTGTQACQLASKQSPSSSFSANSGLYVPRAYTGLGTSVNCGNYAINDTTTSAVSGRGTYGPYPDPITGGMLITPRVVFEPGAPGGVLYRGRFPGLWAPLHDAAGAHADTFTGSGDLSGYSWLIAASASTSQLGRVLIETSNTW